VPSGCASRQFHESRSILMLDVILVVIGCGLFAVGIAYAYACDKL
jgi:hypothetical protein